MVLVALRSANCCLCYGFFGFQMHVRFKCSWGECMCSKQWKERNKGDIALCARSIGWNKTRIKCAHTFLGHKCVAISCHIRHNIDSNARIFLAQLCPFSKRTLLLRNEIIFVENWNELRKWHKPNACIRSKWANDWPNENDYIHYFT